MIFRSKESNTSQNYVLFYDGTCGLCTRSVQFILKNEKNKLLCFCSLQNEYAEKMLSRHSLFQSHQQHLTSVLLASYTLRKRGPNEGTNSGLHEESIVDLWDKTDAIIEMSKFLKFPFSSLRLLKIIPKKTRDFFYDFVAKRRRKVFVDVCYLPRKEERIRFISAN